MYIMAIVLLTIEERNYPMTGIDTEMEDNMTKKERRRLTRETRMDIINVVMVVISCVLYGILIYVTVLISRQYSIVLSAMNEYISCEKDAEMVSDASSYLTDQVHHYVMDMEYKHVENYFTEANVTKRREQALENLGEYADEAALGSLQEALNRSNALMTTEIYAMRLAAEAQGSDLSTFPQEIRDVQLAKQDRDLSPQEMREKARMMVFDEDYHHAREDIVADISKFLGGVVDITHKKQQDSTAKMERILTIQQTLLIILIAQSLVTLGMIIYNSAKKQKENQLFINQIIHAFARSIDIKDKYTNGHSMRVANYARMIARKAGFNEKEAEAVYNIGLLHDIGKITVPDEILNKPGRLDDDEFNVIKKHTSNGSEILKEIEIAPDLAIGARYHHERIDGHGYPSGMEGDEIPEIAQIIAVADTFDAMYSTRPYRKQMPIDKVVDELKRCAGTQLSEKYVDVLVQLIQEGAVTKVNDLK